MGKKIVVVTGSPRQNGNSNTMADHFMKAVEKKGHTVIRFDAAALKIDGCGACNMCYKNGHVCTHDDDFIPVAQAIASADGIVFASPIYWGDISAQLKLVIDRMYSFIVGGKNVSGKDCALLCCCEDPDISSMDIVSDLFMRMAQRLGWNVVGEVLIPGVLNVGDIEKTSGCDDAAYLADAF